MRITYRCSSDSNIPTRVARFNGTQVVDIMLSILETRLSSDSSLAREFEQGTPHLSSSQSNIFLLTYC